MFILVLERSIKKWDSAKLNQNSGPDCHVSVLSPSVSVHSHLFPCSGVFAVPESQFWEVLWKLNVFTYCFKY